MSAFTKLVGAGGESACLAEVGKVVKCSGRVNGGHDGMDCDLGQGSKEWVVCLDWGVLMTRGK